MSVTVTLLLLLALTLSLTLSFVSVTVADTVTVTDSVSDTDTVLLTDTVTDTVTVTVHDNHTVTDTVTVTDSECDSDTDAVMMMMLLGVQCQFVVDTSKAGGGALSVTVDGPSKVNLDCCELQSAYQFSYCPAVAGLYTVTVKYAGDTHITGSPFLVSVRGTSLELCSEMCDSD